MWLCLKHVSDISADKRSVILPAGVLGFIAYYAMRQLQLFITLRISILLFQLWYYLPGFGQAGILKNNHTSQLQPITPNIKEVNTEDNGLNWNLHCFKYNKLLGNLRLFDLKKPSCFALGLSSNQIISIASEFIWYICDRHPVWPGSLCTLPAVCSCSAQSDRVWHNSIQQN